MAEVATGNEVAFRQLAGRHLDRILRLARRMVGSAVDADEIAQETLIRIWFNAARFDARRARVTTWIYRIAYNLCIDRLRRPGDRTLDDAATIADSRPNALDGLTRRDDLARLHASLRGLPERQRAALILFYYEDLAGQDAAAVLGVSLRAFWSLLHRARRAVQLDLAGDW